MEGHALLRKFALVATSALLSSLPDGPITHGHEQSRWTLIAAQDPEATGTKQQFGRRRTTWVWCTLSLEHCTALLCVTALHTIALLISCGRAGWDGYYLFSKLLDFVKHWEITILHPCPMTALWTSSLSTTWW